MNNCILIHKSLRLQKVLIFVNYDIDAICAAKILQAIFRYDSIVYTLIPVSTISDLILAYNEHKQDVSISSSYLLGLLYSYDKFSGEIRHTYQLRRYYRYC